MIIPDGFEYRPRHLTGLPAVSHCIERGI